MAVKPTTPTLDTGHALYGGLQTLYPFSEGSGTTIGDLSGNSRDGTATGASWDSDGTVGDFWVNDSTGTPYIDCQDLLGLASITNAWSWAVKIKSATPGSSAARGFMGLVGNSLLSEGVTAANSALIEVINDDFSTYIVSSNVVCLDGSWHWVWCTCDGSDVRFYLDGSQVGSDETWTRTLTTGADWEIGQYNSGSYAYLDTLQIAFFALWDEEITSAEVSTHESDEWGLIEGTSGVTGTSVQTINAFSSDASGAVDHVTGTSVQTINAFSSDASGSVGSTPVTGTSVQTINAFSSAAAGAVDHVTGTSVQTVNAFSSAATGQVGSSIVTGSLTLSRTSGPAPLFVFADMTGTTATGITYPFHDLNYDGDWDDATYSPAGDNRTIGACQAHVYSQPGTYTFSCTITDPVTGDTALVSDTITVSDPDSVWSGADTIVVSSTGTFTGKPAGATEITSSDFDSTVNTYAGAGKRLLFRRGETFTSSAIASVTGDTPAGSDWTMIGAFGTGAKPYIQTTGSSGSFNNVLTFSGARIIFSNLYIDNTSDASNFGFNSNNSPLEQILFYQMDFEGFRLNSATGMDPLVPIFNTDPMNDQLCYAYCTCTEYLENAIYWGGTRMAAIGNSFDSPTAHYTVDPSHTIRSVHSYKSVYWRNTINQPFEDGSQALKIHHATDSGYESTGQYIVLARNTFGCLGPWTITIGPQNGGLNEAVEDVLIEGNYFDRSDTYGVNDVMMMARRMTVRNNVSVVSDQFTSNSTCFYTYRWGSEPIPQDHWVYNNTLYVATLPTSSFEVYIHSIDAGVTPGNNPIVRNNVASDVSNSGRAIAVGSAGGTTSSNNVDSGTNPFFADAAGGDFTPTGSSTALVDQGTSVPLLFDYNGATRTGTYDIGAIEVVADVYGTSVQTINAFSSSASGSVASQDPTGTSVQVINAFSSSASGVVGDGGSSNPSGSGSWGGWW